MSISRFDEVRDYAFADQVLALRKRAGLTQRDLADLLHVSTQSIHAWEAGLSYPGSERLKQIIALYLQRGAFTAGQEEDEAAALWATARERAARRTLPFDPTWFSDLWGAQGVVDSGTRPPTNLPDARTSFIGRAAEVTAIAEALSLTAGAGPRLLTVTGVAGCGKTRLALAVAETLRDSFEDGVWLVELAPLPPSDGAEPTAVVAATLTALGLHQQAGESSLDTLAAQVRDKDLLLVLDNCEHVATACATLFARLAPDCPRLRILATSQCSLGMPNETVFGLTTFAVPGDVKGTPSSEELAALSHYEAVQLFLERARAVQPAFTLSAESAAGIATICRRLDGLPLAIELAAARLNVLSLEDVIARSDDRFRLLRHGRRALVDRHQALQATMDWSYSLLDPIDQAVLRRLAVFAGGWDLAAAEAVCSGDMVEAEAVLESLDELMERSLLYAYSAGGVPRYSMLETVRHYGRQQLDRTGELATVRDRHLEWCVGLAERASTALLSREQVTWLAHLDREHDNLRAAMQWALDRGSSALGLRIAAGLWQFWRNRGHLSEGRRWLDAFLSRAADDEDDSASIEARASALEGAAWLAEDLHDFDQAAALFEESGTLLRALRQDRYVPGPLVNAALEARFAGDYARATSLLEESLARHRALGDRGNIMSGGLGLSLVQLALVLRERGEAVRARALCEECVALHREQEDGEGVASALLALSDVYRDLGETARVRACCEECLPVFREFGLQWAIGFSLNNLALAAMQEGDLAQAAAWAEESEAIFRELQSDAGRAEVLITLGRVRGAQGAAAGAHAVLAEALRLAWADGPRLIVAAALEEIALETIREREPLPAVPLLSAATSLRQTMGAPIRPADQPRIEAGLATARAALPSRTFASAWTRGQTSALDDVIAPVLGSAFSLSRGQGAGERPPRSQPVEVT